MEQIFDTLKNFDTLNETAGTETLKKYKSNLVEFGKDDWDT